MSVVWVVYGWWPHEGGRVAAVFNSEEGATAFIAREQAMHGQPDPDQADEPFVAYPEYEVQRHEVRGGGDPERVQRHLERLQGHAERGIDRHVEEESPEPADRLQEFIARTGLPPYWVARTFDVSEYVVTRWLAGDEMRAANVQRLERMLADLPDDDREHVYTWIFTVPETGVVPWIRWTAHLGSGQLSDRPVDAGRAERRFSPMEVLRADKARRAEEERVALRLERLQQEIGRLHADLTALYLMGIRAYVVEDTDDGPRLGAFDHD